MAALLNPWVLLLRRSLHTSIDAPEWWHVSFSFVGERVMEVGEGGGVRLKGGNELRFFIFVEDVEGESGFAQK